MAHTNHDQKTTGIVNDGLQDLRDVSAAIGGAVDIAKQKEDRTCLALAAVLLMLQAAINGGGIEDWVAFSQKFGAENIQKWRDGISAQQN